MRCTFDLKRPEHVLLLLEFGNLGGRAGGKVAAEGGARAIRFVRECLCLVYINQTFHTRTQVD